MPVLNIWTPTPQALQQGDMAMLCRTPVKGLACPVLISDAALSDLSAGAFLGTLDQSPLLQVLGRQWLPGGDQNLQQEAATLMAVAGSSFTAELTPCRVWQQGFSLAWITLSDSGYQGLRQDGSGPQIPEIIATKLPLSLDQGFVLPDDLASLKGVLSHLALNQKFDMIVTTGGTGVTSRDITPEATLSLIQRRLPGFEQAMLSASMAKTHHGLISRAVAGILHRTLIINLPGSPKAVAENLTPLLPALRHCLDKIHDDPRDCASS